MSHSGIHHTQRKSEFSHFLPTLHPNYDKDSQGKDRDSSYRSKPTDQIPYWRGPPRNELERTLRKVAPRVGTADPEVMIALCSYSLVKQGMFNMFLETLLQSGVKNYLIVGLDQEIVDHLTAKNVNVIRHKLEKGTGIYNHAISAKKFKVIKQFLELGWNVLLTDVDVVVLRNPFQFLYRDHDVEAMTDGFDDASAYGGITENIDESMGWARYSQGTQHLNLNSGLFYTKSNVRTIALMSRVTETLEQVGQYQWDQAVFNNVLFFLSHGDYLNPNCSVRVMQMGQFMNSKVLFKDFRFRPRDEMLGKNMPVMIHVNYHPDKGERMTAIIDFFLRGDGEALNPLPGGSEKGT